MIRLCSTTGRSLKQRGILTFWVSRHVSRLTTITRTLDKGISKGDIIQAITVHRNIATVQCDDSNKFSLEHNAANRLDYED